MPTHAQFHSHYSGYKISDKHPKPKTLIRSLSKSGDIVLRVPGCLQFEAIPAEVLCSKHTMQCECESPRVVVPVAI